jgi:hypothetical protein
VPFKSDIPLDLRPRTDKQYIVSSAHRRHQANKSWWIIPIDSEVDCFITSIINNWIESTTAWGNIHNGNGLEILGNNSFHIPLKLAKFVDSANTNIWHGYPADYVRNEQDRPGIVILQDWRIRGIIEKHHVVKIRKGKECNL